MAFVDIEESIHVDAPPARVWALVTDIRRHPEFAGPKSITKVIDFDGPVEVGQGWIAHEKFGPQKFDAPSEITGVVPEQVLSWVSYPPMKDANRGDGGKVLWAYRLEPEDGGTQLVHTMQVLAPAKGVLVLKTMYKVFSLPRKQREGVQTSLQNIKAAAEGSRPVA